MRAQRQRKFDTTLNYGGFSYTRSYHGTNRDSYRCSVYRSTGCRARLVLERDGNRTRPDGVTTIGAHTCESPSICRALVSSPASPSTASVDLSFDYESPDAEVEDLQSSSNQDDDQSTPPLRQSVASTSRATSDDDDVIEIIDAQALMEEETDRLAILYLDKSGSAIWALIHEQFYAGHTNEISRGLTREQMLNRVYRARTVHFGGTEPMSRIENPPLSMMMRSNQPFLQFSHAFYEKDTLHRAVGWAHPALLSLLNYRKTALLIDGTFKSVPRSFYQCLVVMVYDEATDVYVPVFHVLVTGKSEFVYKRVLACVMAATGDRMDPATVTCDFELALHNSVKSHFSETSIVGCFFHWKQAIRRWLLKQKMPEEEVSVALSPGFVDKVTVTQYGEIESKAIPWIKQRLAATLRRKKICYSTSIWDKFWGYFCATWIRHFGVSSWNYTKIDAAIINRTNNPLERYNRTLNGLLVTAHPSLPTFVLVIEAHARTVHRNLLDIQAGRARAPAHAPPYVPTAAVFI